MRQMFLILATALTGAVASPAAAQLRPLVAPPETAEAALSGVDVFLINEGREAAPVEAPSTVQTIARDGTALTLELIRSTADTAPVAAGGFVKLRYRLAPFTAPPPVQVAREEPRPTPVTGPGEQVVTAARGSSSAFFNRFTPHEPIYGVFGLNDAGAKLNISLAFQPIGGTGFGSHFRFAYTQTVFWAIQDPSGPIRNNNYAPEVFYDLPVGRTTHVAVGFRHDSNGGDVTNSVDLNRVYFKLNKTFLLGHDWRLDVGPQGWIYLSGAGSTPDADRYFGNAGINASIEQTDGLKVAVYARGNPRTERGSAELFVSYPLKKFGVGDFGFYLFGQVYTGYGEALTDYRRADTHARLGISLTR